MNRKNDFNKKGNKSIIIGVAVAAIAAIVGGVVFSSSFSDNFSGRDGDIANDNTTSTEQSPTLSQLSVDALTSDGSATLKGNLSAKITLIEFGDFQCPFCARFTRQTEPQIDQEYIQTGKVNMVFKHFVRIGPNSLDAAIASQCADEQGKFWQYHDLLYQNQGQENSGWASKDNLKNFASQIGMDGSQFGSCLDSGKYRDSIKKDTDFAASLGLRGTPSFIIVKSDGSDPEKIEGAYPFAAFKQVLDKKLAEVDA